MKKLLFEILPKSNMSGRLSKPWKDMPGVLRPIPRFWQPYGCMPSWREYQRPASCGDGVMIVSPMNGYVAVSMSIITHYPIFVFNTPNG